MVELKLYIQKVMGVFLIKKKIKKHIKEAKVNNIENIDLVIVNFYPFEKIIKNSSNQNKIIENIDIGGPTMVRCS